jgi:hypothetical protein
MFMKKLLLLLVLAAGLSSCVSFAPYVEIKAVMVKPMFSQKLVFEDDDIGVSFAIAQTGLSFVLINKSNRSVKLIWDDVSMVKNGEAKKTMHKGVKYIDAEKTQPSINIPPGATIDEIVFPSENAFFVGGQYGGWTSRPIFTAKDTKSTLGLLLPIEVGGEVREYYFVFDVDIYRSKYSPTGRGSDNVYR